MIRLSEQLLREQLDFVENQRASDPGWVSYETAGRLRYWLGDRAASDVLKEVADHYYSQLSPHAEELINIGYLYYLATEHTHAETIWRQAYEKLLPHIQSRTSLDRFDIGLLIESCTLIGEDTKAEGLTHAIINLDQSFYPPPPIYTLAAQLSRARRVQDVAMATVCVEQCEQWIKRYHDRIGLAGTIGPCGYLWNWYDYALQVVAALDPARATKLTPTLIPGVQLPTMAPEEPRTAAALQRLPAYDVSYAEWVYYVWNTHDHIAFQQLIFADGTRVSVEIIDDLELLESLWDCIELPLNAAWNGMHKACGVYQLDIAQHTIRRVAEVLDGREWEEDAEPTSLAEMAIRPLSEEEQLVVDVLDV